MNKKRKCTRSNIVVNGNETLTAMQTIFSSACRHNPHKSELYDDNKTYWAVKHRQIPAWGGGGMIKAFVNKGKLL